MAKNLTRAQSTQSQRKPSFYRFSIPLYGPLNIKNAAAFMEEQRMIFKKCFPLPCPMKSVDEFDIICKLGEGGFGKVYLVVHKQGETLYAMKMIKKKYIMETNTIQSSLIEKRILQSLNFPFLVGLQFVSQDKGNLYYFLPFIPGGEIFTLLQKLKRFNEHLAKFYTGQVILALEFLHYCGFVYRDLKPENILIDHTGYAKITDFGFTKQVKNRLYTFCGTPEYMAPEIILGLGHTKAVDFWSLGVLVYEMVNGKTPFESENNMEVFMKIVNCKYEMPEFFGQDLQDIITNLLQVDVTCRYGNLHKGFEDIKQHKWFKPIDWLALLNRTITPPYIPAETDDITANFPTAKRDSSLQSKCSNEDYSEYFKDF